jgi:hypothetical protein
MIIFLTALAYYLSAASDWMVSLSLLDGDDEGETIQ